MSRARRIFSHVFLGRLLLLLLVTAPPAACTKAEEAGEGTPVRATASKGPVELTLTADRGRVDAGSPLAIEIIAESAAGVELSMPLVDIDDDGMLGPFHVLQDESRPDYPTVDGRIWSQRLVVDTFQSGTQAIPPVTARFVDRRGDIELSGEVTTSPLDIEIGTALTEAAQNAAIRDIRGPVTVPLTNWGAWIVSGGVLILLIGGIVTVLIGRGAAADAPPLPPHILAQRELDALEAEGLLQRRCFQPFYFQLTDIVRHYIEGRFGLLAPTRTTPEFLDDMRTSDTLDRPQQEQLMSFLRIADLVKFALHEPQADEGHDALHMARCFVVDTQPRAEERPEETT